MQCKYNWQRTLDLATLHESVENAVIRMKLYARNDDSNEIIYIFSTANGLAYFVVYVVSKEVFKVWGTQLTTDSVRWWRYGWLPFLEVVGRKFGRENSSRWFFQILLRISKVYNTLWQGKWNLNWKTQLLIDENLIVWLTIDGVVKVKTTTANEENDTTAEKSKSLNSPRVWKSGISMFLLLLLTQEADNDDDDAIVIDARRWRWRWRRSWKLKSLPLDLTWEGDLGVEKSQKRLKRPLTASENGSLFFSCKGKTVFCFYKCFSS